MINAQHIQITPELLSLIAEIDEFKGAWRELGPKSGTRITELFRKSRWIRNSKFEHRIQPAGRQSPTYMAVPGGGSAPQASILSLSTMILYNFW